MTEDFGHARFIVASRPHAAGGEWLVEERFEHAELQDMELPDTDAFVDHWHEAAGQVVATEEERAELPALADALKKTIRERRAIRNLAVSPLLCAMLCALHRDRRRQLPRDRIDVYEACCRMLLERRDIERAVDLSDYPDLSYLEKRALLDDLAYHMLKNGYSEVALAEAEGWLNTRLPNMTHVPTAVAAAEVLHFIIERSGILREPVPGQLDFTHRTFQEYMAAQAAVDEGDIGLLLNRLDEAGRRHLKEGRLEREFLGLYLVPRTYKGRLALAVNLLRGESKSAQSGAQYYWSGRLEQHETLDPGQTLLIWGAIPEEVSTLLPGKRMAAVPLNQWVFEDWVPDAQSREVVLAITPVWER